MKCVTCKKAIEDCNCACFIYEYEEETEEPESKPIHYLCHYCGVQYQMENNNASTTCCGSQIASFTWHFWAEKRTKLTLIGPIPFVKKWNKFCFLFTHMWTYQIRNVIGNVNVMSSLLDSMQ